MSSDPPYDVKNKKHIHISRGIVRGFIQDCQLKSFSTMKTEYDPTIVVEKEIDIFIRLMIFRAMLPIQYVICYLGSFIFYFLF